jgi:L-threonine kinase
MVVRCAARSVDGGTLVGRAQAVGTCGELVQGVLASGEHFHVTLPIDWRGEVALRVRSAPDVTVDGLARGKEKLARALVATASLLGTGPVAIEVKSSSTLPVGRGMGSSTADVVAGARALADAVDAVLAPEQLAGIATGIERSDGTMYDGVVAFCPRTGQLLRRYPWHPRFAVVMAIPPEQVRTESVDFTGKVALAPHFEQLLADLDEAAVDRDPFAFADAATRSATLNQPFLVNRLFDELRQRQARLGAAGTVIGHTGTVAGLLFPVDEHVADGTAEALGRARFAAEALAPSLTRARLAVTLTSGRSG